MASLVGLRGIAVFPSIRGSLKTENAVSGCLLIEPRKQT